MATNGTPDSNRVFRKVCYALPKVELLANRRIAVVLRMRSVRLQHTSEILEELTLRVNG